MPTFTSQKEQPKSSWKFLKLLFGLLTLIFAFNTLPARADNLMQVYTQAISNDPTFKQAEANWLSARMQLPIAIAALLPNISAQAAVAYNNQQFTTDASFTQNGSYYSSAFSLSLYQPLFNWQYWKQIEAVNAQVKAATANYNASFQDLMVRTVKAYFNVLQANEMLRISRANKKTLAQQYDISKQKFDVGLAPITDVYDSQAQYDQAVAQEIAYQNQLEVSLEALHEITNVYYQVLDGLPEKGTPLIFPVPNDIDAWSSTAEKQNYQVMAQRFSTEAARTNISIQAAAHLPNLSLQGQYSDQTQYNRQLTFDDFESEDLKQKLLTAGLVLQVPIFSGGSVVAQTRKARYDYASASAKLEYAQRQIVGQTRQSFLGVVSNISKIKADRQSIVSAENALKSSKANYEAGTRTMIDVLKETTQLYQAQQQYAFDQYDYMSDFVSLKNAAGTLSPEDISKFSAWLNSPIDLSAAKKDDHTEPKEQRQASSIPATPGT